MKLADLLYIERKVGRFQSHVLLITTLFFQMFDAKVVQSECTLMLGVPECEPRAFSTVLLCLWLMK